jgi:hypothetical protein
LSNVHPLLIFSKLDGWFSTFTITSLKSFNFTM